MSLALQDRHTSSVSRARSVERLKGHMFAGRPVAVDHFLHACDASAAVLISGTSFFAASTDEDCILKN